MSGSPDPAPLRDLFLALFGEAQLRRLLSSLPHRELVEPDLPGQGATLGQLASDAAVILHRQRLIDAALFEAMLEQAPRRRDEILAVAAEMGVEVAMPRSAQQPKSARPPIARPPSPLPEPVVRVAPRGGVRWGLWVGLGVLGLGAVGVAMLIGLAVGQGGRPQPRDSALLDVPVSTTPTAPAPAPAPAPEADLLRSGTYEATIYLAGIPTQGVMLLASDGAGGATFATTTGLGLWYRGVIQRSGAGWVVQVTQSNDTTSLVGPIPNQISRAGSVLTFQSAAGVAVWRQIE